MVAYEFLAVSVEVYKQIRQRKNDLKDEDNFQKV